MVELTNEEKKAVVYLLKQELKEFEEQEKDITRPSAALLAIEESYDEFLKKLIKKLE